MHCFEWVRFNWEGVYGILRLLLHTVVELFLSFSNAFLLLHFGTDTKCSPSTLPWRQAKKAGEWAEFDQHSWDRNDTTVGAKL